MNPELLSRSRRFAVPIALIAVPLGAAGLYFAVGSRDLSRQSFADRNAAIHGADGGVAAAFARVEAHLQRHPEDGRGWETIAPVYMRLGRYDDAVTARTNALRLLGPTAEREADVGEALVAAANGIVTAEAKAAFDDAIRLDPTDVSARYYQGVAAEQDGNRDKAIELWQALLADAPEGAAWADTVRHALARAGTSVAVNSRAPSGKDGPTGNAAVLSPASGQDAMIRDMVNRLSVRLHQDGSDVDGWLRLVRSYKVLKETESERAAVADALTALAGDPEKVRRLDQGIAELERSPSPANAKSNVGAATSPTELASGHDDAGIPAMVEQLARRLHGDGSDTDGWIMLVRSYKVLGEAEQARAAVADANRALADKPDELRRFAAATATVAQDATAAGAAPSSTNETTQEEVQPGQNAMVRGMVDRLAARLSQQGSDVDGWTRLVRSYQVLGEPERAHSAVVDARRALADNPEGLHRFEGAIKNLGISE